MKYKVICSFPGYGFIPGEILEEVADTSYGKMYANLKENSPIIYEKEILDNPDHFESVK